LNILLVAINHGKGITGARREGSKKGVPKYSKIELPPPQPPKWSKMKKTLYATLLTLKATYINSF